jgi:hypothetical protein
VSHAPDGAYRPGTRLTRGDGSKLRVGAFIDEGAEGFVYGVAGEPSLVLKHFNQTKLAREPELQSRLEAMVAARPQRWRERSSGHVLLTWPIDTVLDGGTLVGYVMPRIDTASAVEVHVISNASDRRAPSPKVPAWVQGFTWEYLLQTASNLARATDALHDSGCVFGDFNDRNILVTSQARVTLVDCDSMQVPSPRGGAYLCQVGRPEFNAPELALINLGSVPRAPSSDLFPLAVHIHQLLLEGVHPFDGVWRGRGEKPKRPELAADGRYVYTGDRLLAPHELWMGFDLVPESVQGLFLRAFVEGARDPSRRPTGAQWREILVGVQASLQTCKRNPSHVYGGHLHGCPWCKHEARVRAAEAAQQRPLRPPAFRATAVGRQAHAGIPRTISQRRRSLNRPGVWIATLVAIVAAVLVINSLHGSGTPGATGQTGTGSTPLVGSTPTPSAGTPTTSRSGSGSGNAQPPSHASSTTTSTTHPATHHSSASHPQTHASAPTSHTGGLTGSATPAQNAQPSSPSGLSGSAEHQPPATGSPGSGESSSGGLSGSAGGEGGSGLSGSASH